MQLQTVLQKLIEETQASSENYLINESPPDDFPPAPKPGPHPGPGPIPPRPIGPGDCSYWYIWAAIIVILLATIALVIILVYYCRRSRDRRPSLDAIITNIELQNHSEADNQTPPSVVPTVVSNRNVHDILAGRNPARITIIQKY